jgi:hypothetical protein
LRTAARARRIKRTIESASGPSSPQVSNCKNRRNEVCCQRIGPCGERRQGGSMPLLPPERLRSKGPERGTELKREVNDLTEQQRVRELKWAHFGWNKAVFLSSEH